MQYDKYKKSLFFKKFLSLIYWTQQKGEQIVCQNGKSDSNSNIFESTVSPYVHEKAKQNRFLGTDREIDAVAGSTTSAEDDDRRKRQVYRVNTIRRERRTLYESELFPPQSHVKHLARACALDKNTVTRSKNKGEI